MRYYVQAILDGIFANFEIAFRTIHAVHTRIWTRTAFPVSVPIQTSLVIPSLTKAASHALDRSTCVMLVIVHLEKSEAGCL